MGPLNFNMDFRINLPVCEKTLAGIWIGFVWNRSIYIVLLSYYTFWQFRKRGVFWSIFVLENLARVKRNERRAWRFPSPSATSCFRAAISPPPAPQRTLWWGQGLSARKGREKGTPRRWEATWLGFALSVQTGRKLSGQQLESPCPQPPQEDVFFLRIVWNSDLWIPPWSLVLLKIVLDTFLRCYFIDNTEHLVKD